MFQFCSGKQEKYLSSCIGQSFIWGTEAPGNQQNAKSLKPSKQHPRGKWTHHGFQNWCYLDQLPLLPAHPSLDGSKGKGIFSILIGFVVYLLQCFPKSWTIDNSAGLFSQQTE
jgi:hypothetical protein